MSIETIRTILDQAEETGTIDWIYFEGGEPFLYYQVMMTGINEAFHRGFKVGIVTNSYWATSEEDALLCLAPLAGKVHDLSISSDLFHFDKKISLQSECVTSAAKRLDIPLGIICIEQPNQTARSTLGQIPPEESSIMFRGRAAEKLIEHVTLYPVDLFNECPHETLADPQRIHMDPLGYLHICQGICIGNIHNASMKDILAEFDPYTHPITGPLLSGGPRELAQHYQVHVNNSYADACHLCYETRKFLRDQFPTILAPDQMYGISNV